MAEGETVIEILGSSVSALVATERLLAAGVDVRRTPSGKQSPFDWHVLPDGRRGEVGCKLLELSYEPADRAAAWYTPELWAWEPGEPHRTWVRLIADYVRTLIDVGPEVERVARRGNRTVFDPFLPGDPTTVEELLYVWECSNALDELEYAIGTLGPEGGNGRISSTTLVAAARAACGDTIWQTIYWPLLHKITGWTDLPWWQHRKVWLPLWWPQSLYDALRGDTSYRPVRPMHFGCADLYSALETATQPVVDPDIDHHWFDLYDYNANPAVGERRWTAPESVRVGVAWVDDDRPDGVEWLIDADDPVYRRTWRDGICCVEYADGADIEAWAYDCGLTVLDRMTVPVPVGDVVCADPRAVGYGSLNDQILSGLAAADRLIRERG